MSNIIKQVVVDAKTGAIVATTTMSTGAASWFDWTPDGMIKIATLGAAIVGMALSIVLIVVHWRKGRIEYRKVKLEIKILEAKEQDRHESGKREKRRKGDL